MPAGTEKLGTIQRRRLRPRRQYHVIREQERQLGFKFDFIIVCSVPGSTQIGMVVGFAADGRAQQVIGIDASATPQQTHTQILRIAQNTAEKVGLNHEITEADVVLNADYAYPLYGVPSNETNIE